MGDDLDRILQATGAKAAFNKDSTVGDSISGPIVSIDVRPATDYQTKEVLLWPSGDIKEQILVTIRAEGIVPDDEDDDLHRTVYVKGWGVQKSAFIEAAKEHKPEVGDRFTATFVAEKPNPKGGFPAKVYEYRITPAEAHAPYVPGDIESAYRESKAQAEKLLNMGSFTIEQVAAATALPADEVQAMQDATPF